MSSNCTFEAIASYGDIYTTFIAYFHERSEIKGRKEIITYIGTTQVFHQCPIRKINIAVQCFTFDLLF